jgi:transposase-like protein
LPGEAEGVEASAILEKDRMNVHKNARLTPRGREWIVELVGRGQAAKAVSEAVGVCPRTVRKWADRYRHEGLAGLRDRSSRPHRLRQPTAQAVVETIDQTTAWDALHPLFFSGARQSQHPERLEAETETLDGISDQRAVDIGPVSDRKVEVRGTVSAGVNVGA